jgi:hypothetical protein
MAHNPLGLMALPRLQDQDHWEWRGFGRKSGLGFPNSGFGHGALAVFEKPPTGSARFDAAARTVRGLQYPNHLRSLD